MSELLDMIKGRKSVRTFDGSMLRAEDLDKLKAFAANAVNPFGIPVSFKFLNAKEHGLSCPVLSGDTFYVAGVVEKKPYAEAAFGFSFERFVLYAWSLGIGTTWIAGTMKRELFEKAAGIDSNEMMPCMSPLGYPAKKRSLRERLMRKGVGADSRKPAEQLFFDGSFDAPLGKDKQAEIADLIEMVRRAPSAVNKQPWRIVRKDGLYHFYEKKDSGYVREQTGDIQKVDVGIALCHFVMGLEEQGKAFEVLVEDPGIAVPDATEYIATVKAAD